MARPDITVLGAGIFGLSVAWAAARRGARVRVIDPGGVGAGASGGLVGALCPHVPEQWNDKKAFQLESLLMAAGWWEEVSQAGGGDPGYGRIGRLQPLMDARAAEAAIARGVEAETLWQGQALWRVVPTKGEDWEPASPTGLLIHDDLSARLHPRKALDALVLAIRAKGGEVLPEGEAAGAIVHATGIAGLVALSDAMGARQGGGVKGQAMTLRYEAAGMAQLFVDGLHIVPHADGTVAIGSTSENQWVNPVSTDAQLDALLARTLAALPVLAGAAVVERWAALRPRATSRAPLLCAWPQKAGHFVANGGFKIGFGMAPKVGEVMADLILSGRDHIPPAFRIAAP